MAYGNLYAYQVRSYSLHRDLRGDEGIDFLDAGEYVTDREDKFEHSMDILPAVACAKLLGKVPQAGRTKGCHTLKQPYSCFNVFAYTPHVNNYQPTDN